MSNASNLSTLANVLDDGSDGQFLKSTGSGGVAFDTVAAGAVVYATADLLPLSGFAAGDMAYVTATNRFYINNGSGWYSVSLVNTNPNITSVADASSGTTPFTLATDQTATVITITAADPEEVPLTYGYSVTSGSLNGSTVAQGTGSNTNVFTVTPHASQDATFTLTFTASDGINQATSANAFSLTFITTIPNSKYTAMLVQAVGANNGVNSSHPTVLQYLTDSSSSNRYVTVDQGLNVTTGTFSPYRSGGYSMYFNSSYLKFAEGSTSDFNMGTNAFTIEAWVRPTTASGSEGLIYHNRFSGSGNGKGKLYIQAANLRADYRGDDGLNYELRIDNVFTANTWSHICLLRDTSDNKLKLYHNGTLGQSLSVPSTVGILSSNSNTGVGGTGGQDFPGDIANLRVVNGTAITPTSSSILAIPTNVTNTVLLMIGGNFVDYSGNAPQINNYYGPPQIKAYGPLDYTEYDATDNGGSIYFSGSSDYAQAASSSDFQFNDAPATINFWFYPKSNSSDSLIDAYGNGTANSFHVYLNNGIGLEWRDNFNDYRSMGPYAVGMNQWHYVSIVRDGTTLKFYIGTDLKGTTTIPSNSNFGSNDNINFGGKTSSWHYNGYMTDIRIVRGTAITPTTVPTTPLTNVTNTKLLLNGTDAAIIDKSGSDNLTLNGNTKCTTTAVVYNSNTINSKSILFDGSGDYMRIPSDDSIFSKDYTIEFWMYPTQDTNLKMPFSKGVGLQFYHQSGNIAAAISASNSGTYLYNGNFGSITTNAWSHISLVRDSSANTYKFYINGTLEDTLNSSSNIDAGSADWIIAAYSTAGSYAFEGYIQDLRVTEGLARYTATDETANIPSAQLEG